MPSGNFRRADRQMVERHPVASATTIEPGDLLFKDQANGDVEPASAFTYVTSNLAQTQANFARDFVGVAVDRSDNGDTDDIGVATAGVYEFACAAAQFEIGDQVGPDDNATPDALLDQQVIAMGENGLGSGIGVVVKKYTANTTTVQVAIMPYAKQILPPQVITMYSGLVTGATDYVTDYSMGFPFKLIEVRGIHTVALTTADSVITIDNGATGLDDTLTLTQSTSAVGLVETATMDDATGDDIFGADDTVTIKGDGGAAAGEAIIQLVIAPFRQEQ